MNNWKSRAANDTTIEEAETAQDWAERVRLETDGNPLRIWALLIGMPKRDRENLMEAWQVFSLKGLAEAIAGIEVEHG